MVGRLAVLSELQHLPTTSMPPNLATHAAMAASTCDSILTSHCIASALPPAFSISALAEILCQGVEGPLTRTSQALLCWLRGARQRLQWLIQCHERRLK